ncbi:MAG: hypothetical protein HKN81_11470 [Gammaproteobacteria bacterium]|nr:hypothetical protein [Gammaproteobacteria bacterium]
MKERIIALSLIAASASLVACSGSDDAGDANTASMSDEGSAATARGSASAYTYEDGTPHPVTSWGDPDLQGMWPIMHLVVTPLQRPEQYGDRLYMTDEEYEASVSGGRSLAAREERYHETLANNELGMGMWAESTTRSQQARQTSLISYPDNGQFPALTARGEELQPNFGSSWSTESTGSPFDSPQDDFDTWDRCITRGMPNSMLPFNYNNGIQILQSPGYAIINLEMIHEARVVPIDRAPLDPDIRQWMGESRGYWDGATLVVETTNYNGEVGMTNVGTPGSPRGDTPSTTGMKTTERFTRVSDSQIDYQITIEDPAVLTDRWTVTYPMFSDPEYQFFEYACHEDNTAVRNFIETSRYERGLSPSGEPLE